MASWGRRWARRALSFSLMHVLWVLCSALAPLLVALGVVVDALAGRPRLWARTRTVAFFLLFLWCEVVGLWIALLLWLGSGVWLGMNRRGFLAGNAALQRWWTGALLTGARRLYSMPLEVEGAEHAARGPYLLFARHASTADTVVPASVIANRFHFRFRYVLKKELLWDPCLDVVGNRLPNLFVDRSGAMRARELAAVQSLVADLGEGDGVLIYPEGTRFDPGKLRRALARLEASEAPSAILERARRLRRVLPPRKGGPLALLAAAPTLDVVFLAHTGLEGAVNFRALVRGGLVGRTLRVSVWRVPAAEIPADDDARLVWLFDQWLRVDEWVCARLDGAPRQGQAGGA